MLEVVILVTVASILLIRCGVVLYHQYSSSTEPLLPPTKNLQVQLSEEEIPTNPEVLQEDEPPPYSRIITNN